VGGRQGGSTARHAVVGLGPVDGDIAGLDHLRRHLAVAFQKGAEDNVAASARRCYDLTTLAQPTEMMLRRGLDLLTGRITDRGLPDETITLRGQLVLRGSAGRPG
jgi:hypothetical protein